MRRPGPERKLFSAGSGWRHPVAARGKNLQWRTANVCNFHVIIPMMNKIVGVAPLIRWTALIHGPALSSCSKQVGRVGIDGIGWRVLLWISRAIPRAVAPFVQDADLAGAGHRHDRPAARTSGTQHGTFAGKSR